MPELRGQGFVEILDQVYATGTPVSGSAQSIVLNRLPGAPAEQRYVDFVYQPVRNEAGEVIGIFIQGTDVTDRLAGGARGP